MQADSEYLILYHGARRWNEKPKVPTCRPGRYECGPGIYLTTSANTANKYAKGGGVIMQMELNPDLCWLENARVSLDDSLDFVRQLSRLPARKQIQMDLLAHAQRIQSENVGANILVNLMVNYEALGGQNGPSLAMWLADHGIDASLQRANGLQGWEDWVIVFNPEVIVRTKRLKQSDIDWKNSQLPDVKDQLIAIAGSQESAKHHRPRIA